MKLSGREERERGCSFTFVLSLPALFARRLVRFDFDVNAISRCSTRGLIPRSYAASPHARVPGKTFAATNGVIGERADIFRAA